MLLVSKKSQLNLNFDSDSLKSPFEVIKLFFFSIFHVIPSLRNGDIQYAPITFSTHALLTFFVNIYDTQKMSINKFITLYIETYSDTFLFALDFFFLVKL